jgi:radical SAM superfamily enzyme YgiQ (UPF0313 family)
MDVLLSHGFFLDEDPIEQQVMRPYPPLGLLYLSSHLKARGARVEVFDSTFERRAAFEQLLARTRPPVVALSANLLTRASVLRMAAAARRAGALVVAGGRDPSNYPGEYLAHGADVVAVGEGEQTLQELLPRLAYGEATRLHQVNGIAFRDDRGTVVRTPPRALIANLDAQPFPDRGAIDVARYVNVWRAHHGPGSVSLITARGCPYTCAWCSHSVFGHTHRRRSARNVADELETIVRTWKPDMVWYADDVFTMHHRWLSTYAAELRQRRLCVPFETITREDRLDRDVVETLASMGCLRIWIGSESGSQRVMDAMSRQADVARIREMVRLLQRYGIEVGLFVMLGYEGEEPADLEATVAHLKAAGADRVLTTVAYPIKGTPYYEQVAGRLVARTPWASGSDRDLAIAGRRSRRFYRHATRWIHSEVACEREWRAPRRRYVRLARAFVSARISRLAMTWTRHQREPSSAGLLARPAPPAPASVSEVRP